MSSVVLESGICACLGSLLTSIFERRGAVIEDEDEDNDSLFMEDVAR